jgi:hypothetical protein
LYVEANELNDQVSATVATLSISNHDNPPKLTIKSDEERSQEQPQEPLQRNTDHVPLLDIYHTLEFDMAAMIEQRKLEAYHAQEEAQEHEKDDSAATATASTVSIYNIPKPIGLLLKFRIRV